MPSEPIGTELDGDPGDQIGRERRAGIDKASPQAQGGEHNDAILASNDMSRRARHVVALGRRHVVEGGVPAELQRADIGDDGPAVVRRHPRGVGIHHAIAMGDDVEEMLVGGRAQPVAWKLADAACRAATIMPWPSPRGRDKARRRYRSARARASSNAAVNSGLVRAPHPRRIVARDRARRRLQRLAVAEKRRGSYSAYFGCSPYSGRRPQRQDEQHSDRDAFMTAPLHDARRALRKAAVSCWSKSDRRKDAEKKAVGWRDGSAGRRTPDDSAAASR